VDTVDQYRTIIRKVLQEYAIHKPSNGDIDPELVVDAAEHHFEVLLVGWDGPRRVHGSIIHIDIVGERIWIQYDGTSPGVAEELVEAGIPPEAIVLGFRPRQMRQYSGFATE